ncbi:MAG: hypothetical protein RLY87_1494 [Chloroflexota bacterium]
MTASSAEYYAELQQAADAAAFDESRGSPWNRPILNRICDYVALIVTPLNMRIRGISLQAVGPQRVVVKVAGLQNVSIIFAPVEQLAGEVFLRRIAAQKHLPFPHIIKSDVSFAVVPTGYVISTYISGSTLDTITDDTLQRVGARQIGRAMRTLHGVSAPAFGAPQPNGNWKNLTWPVVLREWFTTKGSIDLLADTVGPHLGKRFWDTWLRQPFLALTDAMVIHGDIHPKHAHVSVSSHVQLDGIDAAGLIVAGDPMLDVAMSMRAGFHAEFRLGFNEGYTATVPLTSAEVVRVKHYLMTFRVIDALDDPTLDRESFATSVQHAIASLTH